MKRLLFIFFMFTQFYALGQSKIIRGNKIDSLNQEISNFIRKEKKDFDEMGDSLSNKLLFIFRMFPSEKDSAGICLSVGYIFQEYEFDYFKFNNFILHGKDTIAVFNEPEDEVAIRKWFDLKPVTLVINSSFRKRLYSDEGELNYHPPGLICCLSNAEVKIEHYDDEGEILDNKSVYKAYSRGVTITYKSRDEIEREIKIAEKNNSKDKSKRKSRNR